MLVGSRIVVSTAAELAETLTLDILDAEFLAQANGGREARGWAAIRITIE